MSRNGVSHAYHEIILDIQAPVAQSLDSVIHWINPYTVDKIQTKKIEWITLSDG